MPLPASPGPNAAPGNYLVVSTHDLDGLHPQVTYGSQTRLASGVLNSLKASPRSVKPRAFAHHPDPSALPAVWRGKALGSG